MILGALNTNTILGRLESLEIQVKPVLWSSRLGILVGEATEVAAKSNRVVRDWSILSDLNRRYWG
jgi:hypothetical protein